MWVLSGFSLALTEERRANCATVEGGRYPIAYLNLEANGGTEESHAVVVVEVGDESVIVYDPLHGGRRLPRQSFTTGWAARLNLMILVEL